MSNGLTANRNIIKLPRDKAYQYIKYVTLCFQVFPLTWIMKIIRHVAVALFALNLVACGGGDGGSSNGAGSSSGGGSGQSANSTDLSKFAGTYTGTITATVTIDGQSETLSEEITFVISKDGKTITVAGEIFPLTSQNFTITVNLSLSNGDITCTFLDVPFNGSISENLISGNLSGTTECVVNNQKVSAQLSGYSGATKTQ